MAEQGMYRLRISADDPASLSPAVREALDALATALAHEEAGDDVVGFGARVQVEVGSLAPRPGAFALPTRQEDASGLVCLGFSWPDGGDPTCGVFW